MGAFSFTLAREMSATTVYSEKVLVPMKWNTCFPLQVKREVPSGSRPWPWVTLQEAQGENSFFLSVYDETQLMWTSKWGRRKLKLSFDFVALGLGTWGYSATKTYIK